jgi:hypothetical protein
MLRIPLGHTTGANYGGYFSAAGDQGRGVYGYASHASGTNYGVYGKTNSSGGYGVRGEGPMCGGSFEATSTSGTNYGGYFVANGSSGRGIYAKSTGSSGYGVQGWATNSSGLNMGGYFSAAGSTGRGVQGSASGSSGRGVHGQATATGVAQNYGGYFSAAGNSGAGVRAGASATGAVQNYGGHFVALGDSGVGVYGYAPRYGGSFESTASSGVNYGVYGTSSNISGAWVHYGGYFEATDTAGYGVRGRGGTNGWGGYFSGGDGLYASKLCVLDTNPAGTNYNTIGNAAASHTAQIGTPSDLYISDDLEVDGYAYFDDNVYLANEAIIEGTVEVNNEIIAEKLSIADNSPPAYNTIGNGTSSHTGDVNSTSDLFIDGNLEVDGNSIYFNNLPSASGSDLGITAGNAIVIRVSTKRFKKEIEDLAVDYDKFMTLRPIKFKWNEKSATPNIEDYGLVAEEVSESAPELVTYDESGQPLSVSYDKVSTMLLKVVQEQQKQIEEFKTRIAELETKMGTVLNEVEEKYSEAEGTPISMLNP